MSTFGSCKTSLPAVTSVRARQEPSLEEIFDPVTALQTEQADLGPAISRKIIENQQGQVGVQYRNGALQIEVSFPAATMHRVASS